MQSPSRASSTRSKVGGWLERTHCLPNMLAAPQPRHPVATHSLSEPHHITRLKLMPLRHPRHFGPRAASNGLVPRAAISCLVPHAFAHFILPLHSRSLALSLKSAPDTVIPDHPAWKRGPPVTTEHISGYGGYLPGSIDHDFGRFVPPRHTEATVTPRTYAAATHWSKEREALVDEAYNQLDANGDGTITFEDLRLLYLVDDGAMEEKGKKEIGTFTRFLDTFVSVGAPAVLFVTSLPHLSHVTRYPPPPLPDLLRN